MQKLFWLFLMSLTVFKKDSHAGFESHSLKSKKSEEGKTNEQIAEEATTQELLSFLKGYEQAEEEATTQELLSFLKSSDPNPEQITRASQLFQNLLPPAKRRVFFECFDAFTDLSKPINPYIKKERINKKTFEIFFKENYLKLDKELSKSLFTDLLSEQNYPQFKTIEISDQEIIALFNRIQNLCFNKKEKQDFMKKALIRILPFTVDKTMQDFFCQQYTFCSKGAKHAILLEASRWEHMWNFSKNEFLQQSQQPKDKLELLKAMSSCSRSTELPPQESINKRNEYNCFIIDQFDSLIKESENQTDPSAEEDVAKSQLVKQLKVSIIGNLLLLKEGEHPEILQRLQKTVKNHTALFDLLFSVKKNTSETSGKVISPYLELIAEKVSIENPQAIQWFAERFKQFSNDLHLQVLIAELMITPENVRSFTQKAALSIRSEKNTESGDLYYLKRYKDEDTIFDFAARELEKQHLILETSEAENIPLKARNTKLNIFFEDLINIIGWNRNNRYAEDIIDWNHDNKFDEVYNDTIKNHEKLKDSISAIKELLGDEGSRSILKSYNFKDFTPEDRQKFYTIAEEIGPKRNLNFVDSSWMVYAPLEDGPKIRGGVMLAIYNNIQKAISNENPTGKINLEEKEWRLSHRVISGNGYRQDTVEFSEEEKEEVRKANQHNPVEKLNEALEDFNKYKLSDVDISPKKLGTQSEEKKA